MSTNKTQEPVEIPKGIPEPDWLNKELYPFKSKYTRLSKGDMHYIDEGHGQTLLFVHGTPTWSFLYRKLISELSKDHRCIAIDHLGFGLSEKPLDFDGKPRSHAQNLLEFIESMALEGFTMVVHDYGGPIGLSAAMEIPERIKGVVLFNSWLWKTADNPEVKKIDRMLRNPLGKFLYLRLNFSAKVLLKQGFSNQELLSKPIHAHYKRPFHDRNSRLAPWRIGKELLGSSQWYGEQWGKLPVLTNKPWLILWGKRTDSSRWPTWRNGKRDCPGPKPLSWTAVILYKRKGPRK
ncbi:alpha/beta fold hydrolase [Muricauda sp. NFXS6]|uniref:alpha/beta fold hydrolase n=1 Tax=Allomuricauda sp. NFXS6 TaxID=2819094 RepID=UPI0032DFE561